MKNHRIVVVAAALLLTGMVGAQQKGIFGFAFSALNTNSLLRSAAVNHDFTTSTGRGFISFSADYWHPISNRLEFETGINYSMQSFLKTVSHRVDNGSLTAIDLKENIDYHVINLPIGIRAEFLNYGFINGGLLIDIARHEPGIGSYFGAGAKLESITGYGIYINPYVKMHSILPVNFHFNTDRILEAGNKNRNQLLSG